MKRLILFLAVFILAVTFPTVVFSDISVEINDKAYNFEAAPLIEEGRTLVPMRAFFEALGAEVKWDPETRTSIGMRGDIVVQIPIGSIYPTVNWERAIIDVPAQIIDDRTYIPLRFVGQALGDEVSWDGDTRTINVARDDGIPDFEHAPEDPETGPVPEFPLPGWPELGRTSALYPPPNSIIIPTPHWGKWSDAWHQGETPELLRQTNATHLLHFGGVAWGTNADFKEPFQHNLEIISDFGLKDVAWLPGWSIEGSEHLDSENRAKLAGEACIDIDGNPIGFYPSEKLELWQCIHSIVWREYRLEIAKRTIDWGGAGDIALDEWLGDFSAMQHDGCFNKYSMEGFREYLKQKYTAEELQGLGIDDINTFDYGDFIREEHLSDYRNNRWAVPLWMDFKDYHMKFALQVQSDLISELRKYTRAQGKEIHFAANTPELMPDQLPIQSEVDYFSAEIAFDFPPEGRMIPYYKVGTSMKTPLFSLPKCHHAPTVELMTRPDLDQLWKIYTAEAYSAQGFVHVPYKYHLFWIDEPSFVTADLEELRPYYNFISSNEQFYNNLKSTSRIAVLFPHSSLRWSDPFRQSFYGTNNLLLDTHFQYDVIFAGDDNWIVDELSLEELNRYQVVVLPDTRNLTDNQVDLLLSYLDSGGRVISFGDIGTRNENNERVDREKLQHLLVEGTQKHGDGWFVYMDGNPGSDNYNERPDPTRKEFARALRELIHPNILTNADENVAMQKYWNSETGANVIHLVNYNYDLDKQRIHTQRDIELEVILNEQLQGKELKVYYASPDQTDIQRLDHKVRAGRVEFQVPELDYYSVVFIGEEGSFKLNE